MAIRIKHRKSRRGRLQATLGNVTGALAGSFAPVPARSGVMQAQLTDIAPFMRGSYSAAPEDRTGALVATLDPVTMGPATVQVLPVPTIRHVQGLAGQVARLSAYASYHTPADLRYTRIGGSGPSGESLNATTGDLIYDGAGPVGSAAWTVEIGPETATTRLADVPEIFFLVGYPEDEELGIYILDPYNRVERGDLWWRTGARLARIAEQGGGDWAPAQPVTLTATAGTFPAGLTFDAATARLRWAGGDITGAVHNVTVQLSVGDQSTSFRVRVLRPTVICTSNAGALPAVLSGVPTRAPGTDVWNGIAAGGTSQSQSLIQTGNSGNDDATPRVILFDNEVIPRNDWFIGNASTNTDFRYMYICGVPRNPVTGVGGATQLGLPYAQQPTLAFTQFTLARFRAWHFKNLILSNCGASTLTQESGLPTRWTLQKVDALERANGNFSNFSNGADWLPNSFPTQANDFRFFASNVRITKGGYTGGTQHAFYVETNGYTWGNYNNLRVMGLHGGSCVQSVVGHVRIRNSFLSLVTDPDNPYAEATWGHETIDPHSHVEGVYFNNELVAARDSTAKPDYGTFNAAMAFLSNRRPARGANTPNWPSLTWENAATTGGPESPRLGAFPPGPATFNNAAFWTAVNNAGLTNAENPYLFRHFFSYCDVRLATGTPNNPKILRVDGTHPCEAATQFGTATAMLGTHVNWVDRTVVWLANNRYRNWTLAQYPSKVERKDSQNVTLVEDGTKYVSYAVTLDNAATGTVRIRVGTDGLEDASQTVKDRIGWTGTDPPAAYNTWTELAITPAPVVTSFTTNPPWPPAKWNPAALGSGPHPENVDPYIARIEDLGGHTWSDQSASQIELPAWFLR